MSESFGKAVGMAAHLPPNQRIITIRTTEDNVEFAKSALKRAAAKIPSPCTIAID
jgi:large subunit ribosomal protein L10e